VIVGDARGILIPALDDYPLGRKALRGLRLIHTHLKEEPLTQDDFTDLALLRLDLIAAIGVRDGLPGKTFIAYLMPKGEKHYEVLTYPDFHSLELDFREFIESLEEEMQRNRVFSPDEKRERAILVSVSTKTEI